MSNGSASSSSDDLANEGPIGQAPANGGSIDVEDTGTVVLQHGSTQVVLDLRQPMPVIVHLGPPIPSQIHRLPSTAPLRHWWRWPEITATTGDRPSRASSRRRGSTTR